jgi:hypothetical protein
MLRKCASVLAFLPLLVFQAAPANACHVVGYANGEPLCATTSDGKGQAYTDGRSWREKRLEAIRWRTELEHRKTRPIPHQGANW